MSKELLVQTVIALLRSNENGNGIAVLIEFRHCGAQLV